MNEAGQLSVARIKFAAGAGFIKSAEAAREPVFIDEITGALALDDSGQRLVVENLRFDAGKTHLEAHGTVTPPIDAAADWAIMLQADPSSLGPERDTDAALAIAKGRLEARYSVAQKSLSVDRFEFQGPEAGVKLSAVLTGIGAQPSLKLDAALQRMPARVALRLWPAYAAPQTRAWFQEHLHGGTMESGVIKLDYDAATLAAALAKKPLPDAAGRFDFAISDGSIDTVPGLPPLTGVDGVGRVTGRTAVFTAGKGAMELGGGRKLTIPDGSFSVKDYEVKPTPATLALHVQAPMEAMSALLAREALKGLHALPAEAQAMKGQFDGQLIFDLKLAPKMGPDDMALRASANVTAISIDNFIGKEKLDNASLAVTYGREGMRAKGEGRAFGAPVSVEVKKPPGAAAEAVVSLNLDEAARARLGFSSGLGLTGPVLARLTGVLSGGDEVKGRVELDLTKAAIDGLLPGWSKPAGKPGKISFNLAGGGEALKLSDIALEAGGVSFGGAAQLTPDGKFISARLTNMRLGPGEDMQAEVSQGADALKINLKGGSIDARPLLSALVSQQGEGRGPRDIDAELHANALIGHNKQSLANADVKLSRRGGQLRSLTATGRFGAQPLSVTLVKKDGPAVVVAQTQDAGAALLFLDLYRRMQGGALNLNMKLGEGGRQDGAVSIKDFILKDEPAMQKLAANGATPSSRDAANQQAPLDPANVPFTKMTASFSRAGGRTDIRDGVLFGQQIGATMSGSVDFARNSVDLNGAFVPAYEVNNLFARVPVLGPLLGGNKNEGLFAVNYRVTGPVSAPILRVNPLSAIAPGFLRTIFGAVDGTRPVDGGHVGEAVALPAPGPAGR